MTSLYPSTVTATGCSLCSDTNHEAQAKLGLPRPFDHPKYRQRNIVERMFGWLKENRKVGTRYDSWQEALQPWSRWLARCVAHNSTFRTELNLASIKW